MAVTRKLSLKKVNNDMRRSLEMNKVRQSIDQHSTDNSETFNAQENYVLIRLSGWRISLKSLSRHFKSMLLHEKAQALAHQKSADAPRNPSGNDNDLAFQSDSWANKFLGSLASSQKEIASSHTAIAEAYTSQIILPLRELRRQVKSLHSEIVVEKVQGDKERQKDLQSVKSLHKCYTNSLQYFTHYKTISAAPSGTPKLDKDNINDPWIVQFALKKQIREVNARHAIRVKKAKATIARYIEFEASIFSQLKTILAPLHTKSNSSVFGSIRQNAYAHIASSISSMDPKAEWAAFDLHYDGFVKREEPRMDDGMENLDDPKAKVIMEGSVHRPKNIPKGWLVCHF